MKIRMDIGELEIEHGELWSGIDPQGRLVVVAGLAERPAPPTFDDDDDEETPAADPPLITYYPINDGAVDTSTPIIVSAREFTRGQLYARPTAPQHYPAGPELLDILANASLALESAHHNLVSVRNQIRGQPSQGVDYLRDAIGATSNALSALGGFRTLQDYLREKATGPGLGAAG